MKEEQKKTIAEAKDRIRRERRERRRWFWQCVSGQLQWKTLGAYEVRGRIFRDAVVLLGAACSALLFYYCFVNETADLAMSTLLFCFYLLPVSMVTILYGIVGGIFSFSLQFIVALIFEPNTSYLLFFHLAAIYIVGTLRDRKRCATGRGILLHTFLSGIVLSPIYYLVFVMIGQENFSGVASALIHSASVIPQCFLICVMLWVYHNKLSAFDRQLLGVSGIERDMRDRIQAARRDGRRIGIGGKIFSLLLLEAVFLGILAAFFANSLVPTLMSQENAEVGAYFISDEDFAQGPREAQDGSDAGNAEETEAGTASGPAPGPGGDEGAFREFMQDMGFGETFAVGRIDADRARFSYNARGIAFDLKLFLMILCAIHPIVLLANYIAQVILALPIVAMSDAMKEFGDEEEKRRRTEKELSYLKIRSGDEIEDLYNALTSTVTELNSYIERIREEQKLREDLRVAQAASEAKSNFLSNVSHEIRTPINAVIGLDEMILRESSEKQIKKYAVDIRNSGKSLLALVNDLLDSSKIEAGKMEIIPVEYELSSVINDLLNMVSSKARDKGLELRVDVSRDIPHLLYGDEIRIKQCILNILNNAVKYTQKGSVCLEMKSRPVSEEEIALLVRVTDTGIGIKEEDLEKLFARFERIEESRNRTIEGTGLGMSIVQSLLDLMGSHLEVRSVYGEGSDFSFEVVQRVVSPEPIGDFNETYLKSLESMEEYRVSFVAPEGRVLVVDDTPMNLNVIRGLLKETLLQVDTATSGMQCLQMIGQQAYDVIFMDQRMPEMDGTETLAKMRELPEGENLCGDAPVICLTANVVSGARETFLQAGFDDYLSKPIDAAKLEQMLAKYLPKEKVLDPESEAGKAAQAATGKDAGSYSAFLEALGQVPGIDVRAGMKNCMKEEILQGAVHDFYVTLSDGPERIEGLWKAGDLREYTVAVHALKSSARLIGATDLSQQAAHLESCGDAGDLESVKALTPALLEGYRAYRESLAPLFETKEEPAGELIDPAQYAEGLTALREAVSAFDFDTADELIGMLKEYVLPEGERERFLRICDLVTRVDRDALLQELK
ncbi:MAG: response regulator [Lachnospiraceae bacterium]|nr:response regulator [Lachnospiraceae bacterium]